jgi:uncharacterized surface protein with fasciclin (FAS1) repeats
MEFRHLLLAALASLAYAQDTPTLTDALASSPELSTLASTVQLFPDLVSQLSAASNITILAPNNDAFTELFAAGTVQASDTNLIQAVLSYHVLNGVYRSTDISETPSFVPTLLTDEAYTNVTGGQVVEALTADGSVFFISGLLENSTVTTAVSCRG